MKAIRITIYLPEETSETERETIKSALLSAPNNALDGLRMVFESEIGVLAAIRESDQARRYRTIMAALEPIKWENA